MLRFIARRILETVPVLFIIATLTFFMMRMAPGGPFDKEKATTPEIRKAVEAYYGLDKPLLEQYLESVFAHRRPTHRAAADPRPDRPQRCRGASP